MKINKWILLTIIAGSLVLLFDYSRVPNILKVWQVSAKKQRVTPEKSAQKIQYEEILEVKFGDSNGQLELLQLSGWGWIIKKDGHIIEKADPESVGRLVATLKNRPIQETRPSKSGYIWIRDASSRGYIATLTSSLLLICTQGATPWMAKNPITLDLEHLKKITITQGGISTPLTRTGQGRWTSQAGVDETSKLMAYVAQLRLMQVSQYTLSKGSLISTLKIEITNDQDQQFNFVAGADKGRVKAGWDSQGLWYVISSPAPKW